MGKLIISQIGGSGGDLDMITATSSDVIKDKIIVGKDGEPIVGSLELVGTASANHVLSGKTFYNTNAKAIQTGSLAIQSAISFSAAAQSSTTIRISWKNPSKGPWTGVKIRMSTSGYPGVSGGTLKYTGTGSSKTAGATSYVDITGLTVATTYYFTCYSYVTGLGDSTSGTNVSAKTNGLWLYNAGKQYYTITDNSIAVATFNSGSISFTKPSNYAESGLYDIRLSFATGNLDLSKYTKLCVQASMNGYSTYNLLRVGIVLNASDTTSTYKAEAKVVGTDSTTLYECPISIYTYTYGKIYIQMRSAESSDGSGGQHGIRGTIYKIWLE